MKAEDLPAIIERDEVRRLMADEGGQLVEVLPDREYEDEHLQGAGNPPLKQLNAETAARLDRDRPVITYCHDYLCDMNARAAWRLERLGFRPGLPLRGGQGRLARRGLPTEGRNAGALRARTIARRDVPTCEPDEQVADVAPRVRDAGVGFCIVVNEERVVLGRLRGGVLDDGSDAAVEDVMEEGPTTTRASDDLLGLATRLHDHDVASIVVTDPDVRLLGVAHRDDADAVLCRQEEAAR